MKWLHCLLVHDPTHRSQHTCCKWIWLTTLLAHYCQATDSVSLSFLLILRLMIVIILSNFLEVFHCSRPGTTWILSSIVVPFLMLIRFYSVLPLDGNGIWKMDIIDNPEDFSTCAIKDPWLSEPWTTCLRNEEEITSFAIDHAPWCPVSNFNLFYHII